MKTTFSQLLYEVSRVNTVVADYMRRIAGGLMPSMYDATVPKAELILFRDSILTIVDGIAPSTLSLDPPLMTSERLRDIEKRGKYSRGEKTYYGRGGEFKVLEVGPVRAEDWDDLIAIAKSYVAKVNQDAS